MLLLAGITYPAVELLWKNWTPSKGISIPNARLPMSRLLRTQFSAAFTMLLGISVVDSSAFTDTNVWQFYSKGKIKIQLNVKS